MLSPITAAAQATPRLPQHPPWYPPVPRTTDAALPISSAAGPAWRHSAPTSANHTTVTTSVAAPIPSHAGCWTSSKLCFPTASLWMMHATAPRHRRTEASTAAKMTSTERRRMSS